MKWLAELRYPGFKGRKAVLGQTTVEADDEQQARKAIEIEASGATYEILSIGLVD